MSSIEHLEIEKGIKQKIKVTHISNTQNIYTIIIFVKFLGLLSFISLHTQAWEYMHTHISYVFDIIIVHRILPSNTLYHDIFLMSISFI